MNIKSLLLGSAAALVAVSGARAADAVDVVAEPEPVEYVRVCDTYGSGYFYIPGTETCLRIGGYVRFDVGMGQLFGRTGLVDTLDATKINDSYSPLARFALRTWTGSETELGTLSTYTETRFSNVAGTTSTALSFAWVQLGGFRIGRDESAFSTFAGYAGNVIQDDLIGYGSFGTDLISYTFDAGNGFSAIISLEDGSGAKHTIDSYVPHIVGGVKYAGGWGEATVVAGYDSNRETFAVKARVDVNVNEQLSAFAMVGYNSYEDGNALEFDNYFGTWGNHFAAWAGASYKVSDKLTANAQVSYLAEDKDNALPWAWSAVVNVNYTIVPGFVVTPEFAYSEVDGGDAETGGYLRFQRSF